MNSLLDFTPIRRFNKKPDKEKSTFKTDAPCITCNLNDGIRFCKNYKATFVTNPEWITALTNECGNFMPTNTNALHAGI